MIKIDFICVDNRFALSVTHLRWSGIVKMKNESSPAAQRMCIDNITGEFVSIQLDDLQAECALVNLAQTSKNFLAPATEALWRYLPSIQPLVELLPEDCWTIHDDGEAPLVPAGGAPHLAR